jgi:hypothetical protein
MWELYRTGINKNLIHPTHFSVDPLMPNLLEIHSEILEIKHADGMTGMTSQLYVHFLHLVQT